MAIKSFKNIHKGKRCFIIGNGPSLNKIDIKKLNNELTFSVNSIYYKIESDGFIPCYYLVEDRFVLIENISEIRALPAKAKFFSTYYNSLVSKNDNTHFMNINLDFYKKSSMYHYIPRFSLDCDSELYAGQTVTYLSMQLAVYMGFKEIILVGMDFDYQLPENNKSSIIKSNSGDINHFHPDYFGKGKTWQDPNLDNVYKSYQMFNMICEFKKIRVFNASVGGKLELFERVNFELLF